MTEAPFSVELVKGKAVMTMTLNIYQLSIRDLISDEESRREVRRLFSHSQMSLMAA